MLAVSTAVAERTGGGPAGSRLGEELLELAVELVRDQGHERLSLREVQRRAGVSPAAAYRHYSNREALLLAVGQRASALLSDSIAAAVEAVAAPQDDGTAAAVVAEARLRAGVMAYLDFAATEPGLFRTVTLTGEHPERLINPEEASRGSSGRGPFQLLRDRLGELAAAGVLVRPEPAWNDVVVWAATHGMAVLRLDGPLRFLDKSDAEAAVDRLLDLILAGLTHSPPD